MRSSCWCCKSLPKMSEALGELLESEPARLLTDTRCLLGTTTPSSSKSALTLSAESPRSPAEDVGEAGVIVDAELPDPVLDDLDLTLMSPGSTPSPPTSGPVCSARGERSSSAWYAETVKTDSVLFLGSEVDGRACCRIAMATLMHRRMEARMWLALLLTNRRVASPLGEFL